MRSPPAASCDLPPAMPTPCCRLILAFECSRARSIIDLFKGFPQAPPRLFRSTTSRGRRSQRRCVLHPDPLGLGVQTRGMINTFFDDFLKNRQKNPASTKAHHGHSKLQPRQSIAHTHSTMHATSNAKKHIPSSQVIDDVRRLLSGTSPQDVNDEVASANVDSRANKFAGDEGALQAHTDRSDLDRE
jgi:hypothetical protein